MIGSHEGGENHYRTAVKNCHINQDNVVVDIVVSCNILHYS